MQASEEVSRLGGLTRCGKDRLLIGLEDLEPVLDVGRVIGTGLQRDPKVGTKERSTQLGHELFDGICVITEAFSKPTIAAFGAAGPMGQLMQERRVVALGGTAGLRPGEAIFFRHLDVVAAPP